MNFPFNLNHFRRQPIVQILLFLIASGFVLLLACLSPSINLLDRLISVPDHYQKADVIVAFSASKLTDCKAHPNIFLRERYAADLLRQNYSRSGRLILSGPYTASYRTLNDCRVKLARQFGILPHQLIIDNQAQTTYENAANTKAIMAHYQWKTALLVTSRSHMFRAFKTMQKQGVKTFPAQVPDYPPYDDAWLDANRISHLQRFLYEYGALIKYKWYGYI